MFSHTLKSHKITPLAKITKNVFFNVPGTSLFRKQHQCHGLEDTTVKREFFRERPQK